MYQNVLLEEGKKNKTNLKVAQFLIPLAEEGKLGYKHLHMHSEGEKKRIFTKFTQF